MNNTLSTVQQVFPQKFGSASNPVKDTPKEREKLTPEGLCPGERFKQLKKQEARTKQQREEEKIKAAAKGIQITNGKVKKEVDLWDQQLVPMRDTADSDTFVHFKQWESASKAVRDEDAIKQKLCEYLNNLYLGLWNFVYAPVHYLLCTMFSTCR